MVYQFRATIPESKIFFRVYQIKADMTLFRFNSFIIDDLGFSPDQMVLFEGFSEKGEFCSEYGLFDKGSGTMDTVTFADAVARGETELHYLFDLRNERYIKLVFEGEVQYLPMRPYPCLVDEKGRNPDQFRARFEEESVVPGVRTRRGTPVPGEDDGDFDDDIDDEGDGDDEIFDGEELYGEDES